MSGITSAINTALSGLQLFEAGINTVANNLANETNPSYALETVDARTAAGPAGLPGTGVQAALITRTANNFAAAQLRSANSANAGATNQATQLTTLSNALTNNGDIQSAINQFFEDISTLAAGPTSAAQRQTVLADAQTVTGTFQSAAGIINGAITGSSETLGQSVASANNLLGQLAQINEALQLAPNDPGLLDQQQAALNGLSSLINIQALPLANGSVVVATGGTVLLDQSGPQSLNIVNGVNGAAPTLTAGDNATPVTTTAADGAIGSAVAASQAGDTALQGLNGLASVFASSVNTAQAQGLTQGGTPGGALFTVPGPAVTAGAANTGTATITATLSNASALPITGGPILLTYSTATGWSAQDEASGQALPVSGTPPVVAGLTLAITGSPANGDQFTLNPAPGAATGIAVATTTPSDIAAADPYAATPGVLQADGSILNNNAGILTPGAGSVTAAPAANAAIIPASYYGQSLQLNFTSATAYTVSTTAAPGTAIASGTFGTAGANLAVAYPAGAAAGQYWQLSITGTPAAGDTLTLTQGGPSSGSNASRLASLFTAAGATTSGSLQQAIVGFSTALGANAQQAQQLAVATTTQVTTATSNLQTVSGVNSDQQAVILTNYQQAYQAAAQAISAAHTMFESLLTAI